MIKISFQTSLLSSLVNVKIIVIIYIYIYISGKFRNSIKQYAEISRYQNIPFQKTNRNDHQNSIHNISLYYFIVLKVKIDPMMLNVL